MEKPRSRLNLLDGGNATHVGYCNNMVLASYITRMSGIPIRMHTKEFKHPSKAYWKFINWPNQCIEALLKFGKNHETAFRKWIFEGVALCLWPRGLTLNHNILCHL